MTGLLLIAHAPLASALKAVAEHAFPNCAAQLDVLDVSAEMSADDVVAAAQVLLDQRKQEESLVLTDVFGATPCNGAMRLQSETVQVISGVNVPMLWRSLCYVREPLAALARRAREGAAAGIVSGASSQNPHPSSDAQ